MRKRRLYSTGDLAHTYKCRNDNFMQHTQGSSRRAEDATEINKLRKELCQSKEEMRVFQLVVLQFLPQIIHENFLTISICQEFPTDYFWRIFLSKISNGHQKIRRLKFPISDGFQLLEICFFFFFAMMFWLQFKEEVLDVWKLIDNYRNV